jgi:hypothetical protein
MERSPTQPEQARTALELGKLVMVAGVVLGCGIAATALATHSEHIERIAPWVTGEGVPVVRLFTDATDTHAELPSFAEASGSALPSATTVPSAAVGHAAKSGPQVGPQADGGASQSAGPASGISPSEYEGVVQAIEGREHLAPFFKQLTRTLRKEPKAITRIAHYGDSAVTADSITSTARRMLQGRFGDAGHGFILIARGSMQHYMHRDIVHRSSGDWEISSIVHAGLRDGHYGY